jgi:hypothetical protein
MLLLNPGACMQAFVKACGGNSSSRSSSSSSQKTGRVGRGRQAAPATETVSHVSIQIAAVWVTCVELLAWHLGVLRGKCDLSAAGDTMGSAAHALDASGAPQVLLAAWQIDPQCQLSQLAAYIVL